MNYEKIKNITIGEIVDFAKVYRMPMKQAAPVILTFQEKHQIHYENVKDLIRIIEKLGLTA